MTMRALVAFASKNGSTAEIAEAIADALRDAGVDVDCRAAGTVHSLEGYDAVVLGSAVYMKRWMADARHLFRRHRRELAELPFWIFSSGPCGAKPDPAWGEPPRLVGQAEDLGVRDHIVFGGRLPAEPAGFMEKAMVRDTPAECADLRDWDQIRGWASGIAAALRGAAVADR
jgi:menaquinone-dependent protoporphyrinogen oxidase